MPRREGAVISETDGGSQDKELWRRVCAGRRAPSGIPIRPFNREVELSESVETTRSWRHGQPEESNAVTCDKCKKMLDLEGIPGGALLEMLLPNQQPAPETPREKSRRVPRAGLLSRGPHKLRNSRAGLWTRGGSIGGPTLTSSLRRHSKFLTKCVGSPCETVNRWRARAARSSRARERRAPRWT